MEKTLPVVRDVATATVEGLAAMAPIYLSDETGEMPPVLSAALDEILATISPGAHVRVTIGDVLVIDLTVVP